MNDYQMTKLSHGHFHELRAEAERSRLAATASRRPSLTRRIVGRIGVALSRSDERQAADWAVSLHRRDAWQGRTNER